MKLKLELTVKVISDSVCPDGTLMQGEAWEESLRGVPTTRMSRIVTAEEMPFTEAECEIGESNGDAIVQLRDSSLYCACKDGFRIIGDELVRCIKVASTGDGIIWDDELEMLASSGWIQELP